MSPNELQNLSARSVQAFINRVQGAELVGGSLVRLEGFRGRLRIKRATNLANQIHVGRGEPIVVHVPAKADEDGNTDESGGGDRWYVLGVRWQVAYARTHSRSAAQHASHAFDCMAIRSSDLETVGATLLAVDDDDLRTRCTQALVESQDRVLRMMIRAINAARDAVANALIDTLQEGLAEFDDDADANDDDQ